MATSYDGPYDHDCGWLECTYTCPQARMNASEDSLRAHNIDRDGKPLGLPICGERRHRSGDICTKTRGHDGFPRPGHGASHAAGGVRWRTFTEAEVPA